MVNSISAPFISVLVTSYNREKYIGECLESILQTTYPNIEILVLDDASTDNTVKIARQFEHADSRIKVIVNEKNLGQFGNRNKAARLANYDYIKFFDSDDIMYSHCLEVFARAIEKYPDAGLYAEYKSDTSAVLLPCCFTPHQAYVNHYWKGNSLLYIGPGGTLFNKKKFFEANGIDKGYGILADTLLSLKLASVSPVVGIGRDTFFWRIHSGQVTEGQKARIQMIKERYIIDQVALNSSDCPLKNQDLTITVSAVKKRFGRNVMKHALKHGKVKSLINLMQSCNYAMSDFLQSLKPNLRRL